MGYSWLITTRCDASLGREAVGGGYHNPLLSFLRFFKVFFVFGLIYLKYCMVV